MISHFTLHRDIVESPGLAVKMERLGKRSVGEQDTQCKLLSQHTHVGLLSQHHLVVPAGGMRRSCTL